MRILPFQYPLLVGDVPATALLSSNTIVKTAVATIPFNSEFVWLHTVNGTIQSAGALADIKIVIFDSVNGPICNVPALIQNLSGSIFNQAAAAPRAIRPFPLPEAYVFNAGAVITATYTITLNPANGGPANAYVSVGLILCGYRTINN